MRPFVALLVLLANAVLFCACSSDPVDQPDAGEDGDADADFEIDPPASPALTPCPEGWNEVAPEEEGDVTTCDPWPGSGPAIMTPCLEGWHEVEDDGVITCDPWPEGGPDECAEDEAHFPGESGCTRIGTSCPEGSWAEDLPVDRSILYVLAGAPTGGEGTEESPFGSVNDALAIAEEGAIVALSKGSFDESVRLRNGVTLWGACVAETVLTCSSPSSSHGTVSVGGRDTVVRNLRISGHRRGVTMVGASSYSVHLEDVLIAQTRIEALLVSGGSLNGRTLVVRDTHSQDDGQLGRGLEAREGAQVEVSRAIFERNREVAVFAAHSGTAVVLADAVVRDTQGRENDGRGGRGLQVSGGACAEVSRVVFDGNREMCVFVAQEGSAITLTDVVVRGTRSQESDGQFGRGLVADDGARADVSRTLFENNLDRGVMAWQAETELTLTDVVVRDTRSREPDGEAGIGLEANEGARADLNRVVLDRNRDVGVFAADEVTTVTLADVLVRDTLSREADGQHGFGLSVQWGAVLDVSRVLLERNRSVGVLAVDADTTLTMSDVVIRDTQSQSDGFGGIGLELHSGARGDVSRALFERNREIGVVGAHESTVVTLVDTVVRDTGALPSAMGSHGVEVNRGAHMDVSRAVFVRNRGIGVFAMHAGTQVAMLDVVIRETGTRECGHERCPDFAGGEGVGVYAGAYVAMTRFLVDLSAHAGVQLAHGGYWDETDVMRRYEYGGTMDLHEGVISNNPIGANVQTVGFDINRLMDRVLFTDNNRNLDMSELPVPDMGDPLPTEDE